VGVWRGVERWMGRGAVMEGEFPRTDIFWGQQITSANPSRIFGVMARAKSVDFGTREWYTRLVWARNKPLILLDLFKLRGNPHCNRASPPH
jgi:hypothetical protein